MLIFEFAMSLFDCVLGAFFITKFNGKSINPKKNHFIIPAVLIVFGFAILNYYFFKIHSIISPVIILTMCSAYGYVISNKNHVLGIVSGVIFATYVVLISALIYSIFFMFTEKGNLVSQTTFSIERIAYLLVNKVALTFSALLSLRFIHKDALLDVKSALLTFVMSLISMLSLYSLIGNVSENPDLNAKIQLLVFSFSLVALNTLILLLVYQINNLNKKNYDLKIIEEKISAEASKNQEIKRIYEDMAQIRHDTNQHLTIINEYLNKGDIDGCKEYIGKLWPTFNKLPRILKSGNDTLDSIINPKIALLHDTQVIITGNVDVLKGIKEQDLVSLFGNILDNAIEATREAPQKLIELHFSNHNSNSVIICKNTIAHPVLKDNIDLLSTKSDSKSHGYGIKIIKRIVSDYNGVMDFFEEDDKFGIEIVFPQVTSQLQAKKHD